MLKRNNTLKNVFVTLANCTSPQDGSQPSVNRPLIHKPLFYFLLSKLNNPFVAVIHDNSNVVLLVTVSINNG